MVGSNDSTFIKIPTSSIVNEDNWYLEVLSSWLTLIELGLIEWFLCTLKKKMSTRNYRGQPLACPRLLVPCSFLIANLFCILNERTTRQSAMRKWLFLTTRKVLGCVMQSFRVDAWNCSAGWLPEIVVMQQSEPSRRCLAINLIRNIVQWLRTSKTGCGCADFGELSTVLPSKALGIAVEYMNALNWKALQGHQEVHSFDASEDLGRCLQRKGSPSPPSRARMIQSRFFCRFKTDYSPCNNCSITLRAPVNLLPRGTPQ